jgi:hypothetical protein
MIVNICSLSVILTKEFRTTVRLSANQEMMYYKWLEMLGEALANFFPVEVAFIA